MVRFHSLAPIGQLVEPLTKMVPTLRDSLVWEKTTRRQRRASTFNRIFAVTDALGVWGVVPQRNKADPAATEWFSPRHDKIRKPCYVAVANKA